MKFNSLSMSHFIVVGGLIVITDERIEEMQDSFWNETNEDWIQEWCDNLTDEESKLVEQWDKGYTKATLNLCEQILEHEKKADK
jgi:hypothetical protein